jgi:ATP-dependent RNA helicase DeaD
VLKAERPEQAIVFVRTKVRCDQLNRTLNDKGLNVKALHGDMTQGARDGVMLAFKGGRLPILVATDVAARGLDISTVTHVVNYDIPTSPDVYAHRIGRTGRMGKTGRAITFVEPRQKRDLEAIEKHIGTTIAPWSEGATTTPAEVRERPRRHTKPHASRNGDERFVTLFSRGGVADGLEVAAEKAKLDGEAVRDVRLLQRFGLLSVPADQAKRVADAVSGTTVKGCELELEPARG